MVTPRAPVITSQHSAPGATIVPKQPSIPEGISFSLSNPRAISYLEKHGAEQIAGIDETTRVAIRDILVQGMKDGWSYDKVAKAIRERFKQFGARTPYKHLRTRAHLIAVSETGNAYEEASFQAAMQMAEEGLAMEKMWMNAGDGLVSEGCLANTAVGWIPIDQPFPSGHMRPLRYEACRCAALYRRDKTRS
jgi:uncharacterized protein with gpF-like domain